MYWISGNKLEPFLPDLYGFSQLIYFDSTKDDMPMRRDITMIYFNSNMNCSFVNLVDST